MKLKPYTTQKADIPKGNLKRPNSIFIVDE